MESVIVLGGAGFIGQHLVRWLDALGAGSITVGDIARPSHPLPASALRRVRRTSTHHPLRIAGDGAFQSGRHPSHPGAEDRECIERCSPAAPGLLVRRGPSIRRISTGADCGDPRRGAGDGANSAASRQRLRIVETRGRTDLHRLGRPATGRQLVIHGRAPGSALARAGLHAAGRGARQAPVSVSGATRHDQGVRVCERPARVDAVRRASRQAGDHLQLWARPAADHRGRVLGVLPRRPVSATTSSGPYAAPSRCSEGVDSSRRVELCARARDEARPLDAHHPPGLGRPRLSLSV